MATCSFAIRRFLVVGGFAVAAMAVPAVSAYSTPAPQAPLAQCHQGEESDVFTTTCTPMLVPNSPPIFSATAANPDVPEIQGIPCIGHNAGACIGLAENAEAAGPAAIPRSTISSSP
ncbi:intersectin-EH binding protein Ibp1 [Mycolicibacterium sp. XJ1819]